MWVELSRPDADRLGIAEGDLVRVTSRRGHLDAPARISRIREGVVFAPWHYGNVLTPEASRGGGQPGGGNTAANDLTLSAWDPVSKQPEFKVAAVAVAKIADGTGPAPAPVTTASAPDRPLDG